MGSPFFNGGGRDCSQIRSVAKSNSTSCSPSHLLTKDLCRCFRYRSPAPDSLAQDSVLCLQVRPHQNYFYHSRFYLLVANVCILQFTGERKGEPRVIARPPISRVVSTPSNSVCRGLGLLVLDELWHSARTHEWNILSEIRSIRASKPWMAPRFQILVALRSNHQFVESTQNRFVVHPNILLGCVCVFESERYKKGHAAMILLPIAKHIPNATAI